MQRSEKKSDACNKKKNVMYSCVYHPLISLSSKQQRKLKEMFIPVEFSHQILHAQFCFLLKKKKKKRDNDNEMKFK